MTFLTSLIFHCKLVAGDNSAITFAEPLLAISLVVVSICCCTLANCGWHCRYTEHLNTAVCLWDFQHIAAIFLLFTHIYRVVNAGYKCKDFM